MSSSFKRFRQVVGKEGLVSAVKNGKALKVVDIRINDATKTPIIVLFHANAMQVDDTYIAFETPEAEALFLQDLYFALEEYNNVPQKSRITNGKKNVTVDQLLAEARKEAKNTSGDTDGEK